MRLAGSILLVSAAGFGADWNARLAADYLDARQTAWIAWPNAAKSGNGPCISCHTNVTYLLARPELGRALGETAPAPAQTQLLDILRSRVPKNTPQEFAPNRQGASAVQALGTESILAALLLASADSRRGSLSAETEQALDRMWSLQRNGTWPWFVTGLDPWEEPESSFYGATLAALAAGTAPGYQTRPDIQAGIESLKAYLESQQQSQPMHNRLAMLWASTRLQGLMTAAEQKQLAGEVLSRQQADGGWTIQSLGPWKEHPDAPSSAGSNAYATAYTAFVLERVGASGAAVRRALDWLRSHQDPAGYWDAASMNKHYEPGSMPSLFMRDAATAFASMALAADGKSEQASK